MRYACHRAVERLVAALPLALTYAVAVVAIEGVNLATPWRFDGLRENLAQALGSPRRRRLAGVFHANLHNLARSRVDVLRMGGGAGRRGGRAHVVGGENLDAALRRGRGAVIVSNHLGPWDAGLAGYNDVTGRLAVLAEVLRPPRLFARARAVRERQGVSVIPIDVAVMREAAARHATAPVSRNVHRVAPPIRHVYSHLRANGVLAIAIDRDLAGDCEPVPLFGRPAAIPLGVIDVAMRSGAALIPGACLRQRRGLVCVGYPEVAYDAGAPRTAEVQRVMRALLERFEPVIREHADQWHATAPIWPANPPPPTGWRRVVALPLVAVALAAGLTAVVLSTVGLGFLVMSRGSVPDRWIEPVVAVGLAAAALLGLRQALVLARSPAGHTATLVRRGAAGLGSVGLLTGLGALVVQALGA